MHDTHNLEAALMRAVYTRDMPTLMALVDDDKSMHLLQHNVLPWVESIDAVRWFWRSIQLDAFQHLCLTMREGCSGRLLVKGFQIGTDFSWGFDPQADVPTLHLNGGAHAHLIKVLPPERYSTARIILREDP